MSQMSTPGTSSVGAGSATGPTFSRIPTLSANRSGANSRLPSPPVSPGLGSPSTPPSAAPGVFGSASAGGGAPGAAACGGVGMSGTWTAVMLAQARERMVSSGSSSSLTSAVPAAAGASLTRSHASPPLLLPRPDSTRASFSNTGAGAARPPVFSSGSAGSSVGAGVVGGGGGGGGASMGSPVFAGGGPQDGTGNAAVGGPDAMASSCGAGSTVARSSIQVAVRVRPLCDKERLRGDRAAWAADEDGNVGLLDPSTAAFTPRHRFDTVFGPDASNSVVAASVALPLVAPALVGVNGTIFAYGVTSSGKTHTMMGTETDPGIVPRVIRELFAQISAMTGGGLPGAAACSLGPGSRWFTVRMSVMEIYNEVLNDLLDPMRTNLKVREDARSGLVLVEGVTEQQVVSAEQALELISRGDHNRKVSATAFNEDSSRSHTITRIIVESTTSINTNISTNTSASLSPGGGSSGGERPVARRTTACLSLIDLAGSESARAVMSKGQRMEGSFINRSLLTLGTVIHKLAGGTPGHVPFRDSKLTRLLQPSLSGPGARVAVVCNITPAAAQSDETANTLKFAARAKLVQVTARTNEILDERTLLRRYQKEVADLKRQLAEVRRLLAAAMAGSGPSALAAGAGADAAGSVTASLFAGSAGLGAFAPSAEESALAAALQAERDSRREVEMESMMMKIKLEKLQAYLEERGVSVDDLFMTVAAAISKDTSASAVSSDTPRSAAAAVAVATSSPLRTASLDPPSAPGSRIHPPSEPLTSATSPVVTSTGLFSGSPSSNRLRNPNRLEDGAVPRVLSSAGGVGHRVTAPQDVRDDITPPGMKLPYAQLMRHAVSSPRLGGCAGDDDSPSTCVGGAAGATVPSSLSPSAAVAASATASLDVGEVGGAGPWPVWSEEGPSERTGRRRSGSSGSTPSVAARGSAPVVPVTTSPRLRGQATAAMKTDGGAVGPQAGRLDRDLRGSGDSGCGSGGSPGVSMSAGSEVDVDDTLNEGLMAQIRDMISEAQLSSPARPGPAAAAAVEAVAASGPGGQAGLQDGSGAAATASGGFRRTDPCAANSLLPPLGPQVPAVIANGARFISTGSYPSAAVANGVGGAFDGSNGGGGAGPASSSSLYRRSTTISTASSSFGAGPDGDVDQDLEMQVLLADREVLNDQLMATEKENERLTAQVADLRRQLGTYKAQLGTYEQLTRQAASELGEIRRLKEAFQARLQRENDALRAQLSQLGIAPAVPRTTMSGTGASLSAEGAAAGPAPCATLSGAVGGQQQQQHIHLHLPGPGPADASAYRCPPHPTTATVGGVMPQSLASLQQPQQIAATKQPQTLLRPATAQAPIDNQRYGVQSMAPFGSPAPVPPPPGLSAIIGRGAFAPGVAGGSDGLLVAAGGSPTRAGEISRGLTCANQARQAGDSAVVGLSRQQQQQPGGQGSMRSETAAMAAAEGGDPAVGGVPASASACSRSPSLQPTLSFGASFGPAVQQQQQQPSFGPAVQQQQQQQQPLPSPGRPGASGEQVSRVAVTGGVNSATEEVLVRLQQRLIARMQARDSGGGSGVPPFAASAGTGSTVVSMKTASAAAAAAMGV